MATFSFWSDDFSPMEFEDSLLERDPDGTVEADLPLLATLALGVLAAVLVGLTAATTVRAGLASVAVGFSVAVGIVVATVGVFELGHVVGSR